MGATIVALMVLGNIEIAQGSQYGNYGQGMSSDRHAMKQQRKMEKQQRKDQKRAMRQQRKADKRAFKQQQRMGY